MAEALKVCYYSAYMILETSKYMIHILVISEFPRLLVNRLTPSDINVIWEKRWAPVLGEKLHLFRIS